jgi:hypothetical protein
MTRLSTPSARRDSDSRGQTEVKPRIEVHTPRALLPDAAPPKAQKPCSPTRQPCLAARLSATFRKPSRDPQKRWCGQMCWGLLPQHICPHPFTASTRQILCRDINATNMASMHHRHRRLPPSHTFTPYPPIHMADLSRPRGNLPVPASPSPNCSRHAAAIALASGQYCCPPVMLVFSLNPLGGANPCTASSTAVHRESSGTFSSTAVPSRQDLNDSDRYPALATGLVVSLWR